MSCQTCLGEIYEDGCDLCEYCADCLPRCEGCAASGMCGACENCGECGSFEACHFVSRVPSEYFSKTKATSKEEEDPVTEEEVFPVDPCTGDVRQFSPPIQEHLEETINKWVEGEMTGEVLVSE